MNIAFRSLGFVNLSEGHGISNDLKSADSYGRRLTTWADVKSIVLWGRSEMSCARVGPRNNRELLLSRWLPCKAGSLTPALKFPHVLITVNGQCQRAWSARSYAHIDNNALNLLIFKRSVCRQHIHTASEAEAVHIFPHPMLYDGLVTLSLPFVSSKQHNSSRALNKLGMITTEKPTSTASHKWDRDTLNNLGVDFKRESDFINFTFPTPIPEHLTRSNSPSFVLNWW